MALHVLIPCKALAAGKSRLAPLLDADERRALCAAFLARTLELALALVPSERCHLVTGDATAVALAEREGVVTIPDPGPGLNEALSAGRDAICGADAATSLLVLPIDLPWAGAPDLKSLLDREADVVIAPDRGGTGTNALLLGQHAVRDFEFCFGAESAARHREMVARMGLRIAVCSDASLAFDVDSPEDYREWQRRQGDAAGEKRP